LPEQYKQIQTNTQNSNNSNMPASLKQLAMESGILNVSHAFFEHFVEHYQNTEFTMDDLKGDQKFQQCLLPDKPKKVAKKAVKKVVKKVAKTSPKKSSPKISPEDRQGLHDSAKCQCRIWKGGLDSVQCSRNKKVGDFCNDHIKKGAAEGTWWLGIITEPRPEAPVGGKDMTVHFWTGQPQTPKEKKSPKETPKEKKSPKKVTISEEEPEVFEETSEVVEEVVNELVDNSIQEHFATQAESKFPTSTEESTEEVDDGKTVADAGDVGNMADFDDLDEDTNDYNTDSAAADDIDDDSDEESPPPITEYDCDSVSESESESEDEDDSI